VNLLHNSTCAAAGAGLEAGRLITTCPNGCDQCPCPPRRGSQSQPETVMVGDVYDPSLSELRAGQQQLSTSDPHNDRQRSSIVEMGTRPPQDEEAGMFVGTHGLHDVEPASAPPLEEVHVAGVLLEQLDRGADQHAEPDQGRKDESLDKKAEATVTHI